MVFNEHFDLFSDSLGYYKYPKIVCGDLKIDTLKSNMPRGKYLDISEGNGCIILGKDATRVTHESSIMYRSHD